MVHRTILVILLNLCMFLCLLMPCASAQQQPVARSIQAPGSWSWVPAQADFFWGLHHLDQQIDASEQSDLAKRFYETAFWKKTYELFLKEWKDRKSDLAIWKARLDNPAAREIRTFLYDIASQDLFLYADENLSRTVEQWNAILPAVERFSSRDTSTEDKADIVAKWVDELVPQVQLPTLMLAGRFSNVDRALARIDELEGVIRLGINFIPDVSSLFKNLRRIEDKRGTRLEWRIASDMIPWDQIPESDVLDRETLQDLRRVAKDKTIVFSIGTLDDYFCIVISGDKDWASRFGDQSQLVRHPQIQRLISDYVENQTNTQTADSIVTTSTYFTSDRVVGAFQTLLLDGFFRKTARTFLLPIIDGQPAESDTSAWLISVLDDASWIDDRIGQHVVRYRGASHVAWMSDQGLQSVQIDRTPMHLLDSTHALDGIRRAGPDPLLILNVRLAPHPEYFLTSREIVRRIKASFEEFMRISDPGTDLGPFKPIEQQLRSVWPIVASITEEWQSRILPNFSGEHLVLVQAGGLQSNRWIPGLGESSKLLALPEASLASGITGPEEFGGGSISIVNSVGRLLNNYGIYLPKAPSLEQSNRWSLGTLPQTLGEAQVGTFQGILATGERWNWIGYSKTQWEAFAKVDGNPMQDPQSLIGFREVQGPLCSAALIDLGGLARLERQWLGFLLEKADLDADGNLQLPPTKTGRTLSVSPSEIMEFLDCFNTLGRLTSISTATGSGETLTRARYDYRVEEHNQPSP